MKEPNDKINAIINAAQNQKHGTSIVISSNALQEAMRLSRLNRGILIKPSKNISNELILAITSIDGAILVDENGRCHAIGVIMDGEAVFQGDKGRGARFNSLCNYVKWRRKSTGEHCMAVIISEDKTMDIYPSEDLFQSQVLNLFDEEGNG